MYQNEWKPFDLLDLELTDVYLKRRRHHASGRRQCNHHRREDLVRDSFDVSASESQITFRDLTMQVNLKGVWWGCKYAIQAMRSNQADPAKGLQAGGSIINTASFVALLGAATPQLACKRDN